MSRYNSGDRFAGECLRKKPLKEGTADQIIARARKEGTVLFKYYCPHCFHWHMTRKPQADQLPPVEK